MNVIWFWQFKGSTWDRRYLHKMRVLKEKGFLSCHVLQVNFLPMSAYWLAGGGVRTPLAACQRSSGSGRNQPHRDGHVIGQYKCRAPLLFVIAAIFVVAVTIIVPRSSLAGCLLCPLGSCGGVMK